MELVDPVRGVGDHKFADRQGVVAVKIDGVSPVGGIAIGEIAGGEGTQEVTGGSSVVIHDIENHADAQRMSVIHETSKIIGSAVKAAGSEKVYSVVTPSEGTIEVGDRHDL